MRTVGRQRVVLALLASASVAAAAATRSGRPLPSASIERASAGPLVYDRGAAGAWQKLRKLTTIASVLHTTAHPDDEYGGTLTRLSRGEGARVTLLSLTRGEAGDNAIGAELFDALGLIRSEELLAAGRYYGLEALYFTSAADYGYSKRLDEALDTWGREALLRDVVRTMRIERPLVVISRFQGNTGDGHGQHQAAGAVTREAFEAAGDPARFPDQVAAGLRPWRPRKLYIGGVRDDEPWSVRVDEGAYSPILGDSFLDVARTGLGLQRSQNGGRVARSAGPAYRFYRRVDAGAAEGVREDGFFDGLDVTWSGLFLLDPQPPLEEARASVNLVARRVAEAIDLFDLQRPSRSVPALADGLRALRQALVVLAGRPEAVRVLRMKERQIEAAITACLALEVEATAMPAEPDGRPRAVSPFGPPPTMGPVVPGQRFEVRARLANGSPIGIEPTDIAVRVPDGWRVTPAGDALDTLPGGDAASRRFTVEVATDAEPGRSYFVRGSIAEPRYRMRDAAWRQMPFRAAPATLWVRYLADGVPVTIAIPVTQWESHVPYGYERRELAVVPAIALTVAPRQAIARIGSTGSADALEIQVELLNSRPGGLRGDLRLEVPEGWESEPARQSFELARAGQRRLTRWVVRPGAIEARRYRIAAVATVAGRGYREGYRIVAHRDLETRRLYREATVSVRGIDVAIAPGLRVGYVMGIGDEVPAAIEQLGARVELLDDDRLATGALGGFDAIMTGTRAYAVRPALKVWGPRLMEFVEGGGHLIVLYNTAELDPATDAPYPAELPRRAEEVSEEDSPVTILRPEHPLLTRPNRITLADFDGWVEQRGSKFFSSWDPHYVPLIATHDIGQDPQRGGWLTARYGEGYYTYFAYAIHRQLAYGVPGAFRLLANLLSLATDAGGSGRGRPAPQSAPRP